MLIAKIETQLGAMIAGSVEEGICMCEFSDRNTLESELNALKKYLQQEIHEGENDHIKNLRRQIDEYFAGTRKLFDIPLVTPGTEFQKKVWNELLNIPYGATRTYQQQAAALSNPLAIRAMASANGMNRISIIIPCHRVIGSDGSLTGYGGGLHRKKWLLDHEKKHSGAPFENTLF
jgi:AraC family transcriptional regulator of adaptative response/methylated-DNA-[protein]-cysteine methyltransferase